MSYCEGPPYIAFQPAHGSPNALTGPQIRCKAALETEETLNSYSSESWPGKPQFLVSIEEFTPSSPRSPAQTSQTSGPSGYPPPHLAPTPSFTSEVPSHRSPTSFQTAELMLTIIAPPFHHCGVGPYERPTNPIPRSVEFETPVHSPANTGTYIAIAEVIDQGGNVDVGDARYTDPAPSQYQRNHSVRSKLGLKGPKTFKRRTMLD